MDHQTSMQQAICLARQAVGTTSPNPAVGAVIVKDGTVIGKGHELPDFAIVLPSERIVVAVLSLR